MTRAVLTGAAGFLGCHLADRLLGEGWEVVGFDPLLIGDESNLDAALSHERFHFEGRHVTNHFSVNGAIDWMLHFASPGRRSITSSARSAMNEPVPSLPVSSSFSRLFEHAAGQAASEDDALLVLEGLGRWEIQADGR